MRLPRKDASQRARNRPERATFKLDGEVLRLRMKHDDRRRRLLGIELILLGQRDTDAVRLEQAEELLLVGEIGARGIAEGVAAAAVALVQHLVHRAGVLGGEAELAADAFV